MISKYTLAAQTLHILATTPSLQSMTVADAIALLETGAHEARLAWVEAGGDLGDGPWVLDDLPEYEDPSDAPDACPSVDTDRGY